MANYIFKNGNVILRCSNGAMRLLFDYLSEAVEDKGVSEEIAAFLERIDQSVYGFGAIHVDLEKTIPSPASRIMLKTLVSKVIARLKEEKTLSDEVAPRIIGGFEVFRDKILD